MNSAATSGLWALFGGAVIGLLAVDLFGSHRKPNGVGPRAALARSIIWIAAALMFSGFVYLWLGSGRGHEFLTGYFIEKALAVDNLFVFALIFEYFGIPTRHQHRVLFWGVFGALERFRTCFSPCNMKTAVESFLFRRIKSAF